MIIYKATNKITGMSYIGQTNRNLIDRWKEHCKPSLAIRSYLSNAIQKYGDSNFIVEELAKTATQDELDKLEDQMILQYNTLYPNGYNLKRGGMGGGCSMSEEAKRKLSEFNKGKRLSDLALKNSAIARKDRRIKGDKIQCTCCLEAKTEFHKNKTTPTGHESLCKPCRKMKRKSV